MPLTPEHVLRLAALVRLELDPAEAGAIAAELGDVLAHIERLPVLENGEIGGVLAPEPILREDTPGADPLHEAPLEIAAASRDGFFLVPLRRRGGGAA